MGEDGPGTGDRGGRCDLDIVYAVVCGECVPGISIVKDGGVGEIGVDDGVEVCFSALEEGERCACDGGEQKCY